MIWAWMSSWTSASSSTWSRTSASTPGLGDSHSAAEEVEYMNGAATTPMGALRAKNGHPEPYHIKFWNIGNEPWGSWQIGRTDTSTSC